MAVTSTGLVALGRRAVTELAAVVGAPAPRAPVTRANAGVVGAWTDGRDPDEVPTSRLRHLDRPIAFRRGAVAETPEELAPQHQAAPSLVAAQV